MVDRFLVWMGAGMVTAGVAAAMVAGAGVAMADSPPGSDAKGTTSSESAKPADTKAGFGHRRCRRAEAETRGQEAEKKQGRLQWRPSDRCGQAGRRRHGRGRTAGRTAARRDGQGRGEG